MSRTKKRSTLSYGSLRIFFGAAFTGLIVWALMLGRIPIDWESRARDKLAERDFSSAIHAATNCLSVDPGNFDVLFIRAQASKFLKRPRHSLDDIEAAISKSPNTTRLIAFKASLLQDLSDHDGAIALLDDAYERLGHPAGLGITATSVRLRHFLQLAGVLDRMLGRFHPDRIDVPALITRHFASTTSDGASRRALIDVLPGSGLQTEIGETLDRAWALLRECDQLLGDIRATGVNAPGAFLNRAEVDLYFGRLLTAKENLQTFLAGSILPSHRQRAHELLLRVHERSNAYVAQAKSARAIVDLLGGPDEAPPPRIADVYEAEFNAAQQQPERREALMRDMDTHLEKHRLTDLRTVAYRGIATHRWEGDPKGAVTMLREVFDALQYQRTLDPSIAEPQRARTIVFELLEAYLADGRPRLALEVSTVLIGLSPDDPEMRRRRADIRHQLGLSRKAAEDLLHAMRVAKRDPELFERWLEVASTIADSAGRTPVSLAHGAAEQLRKTKAALSAELGSQRNYGDTHRLRQSGDRISKAMANIGELAGKMASDPIVAWHMAQEFGRAGETIESRNFLFRAAAREPDVAAFRFRLAQFRLDLGLYETAARDFERILARDPGDASAAQHAIQCWRLAGNIEEARRVASRAIEADPIDAGLKICAEAMLASGQGRDVLRLLKPHDQITDPELLLLVARAALIDGRVNASRAFYEKVLEMQPESPEAVAGLMAALAAAGKDRKFLTVVEQFIELPRIQPSPEVVRLLDVLERTGHARLSAALAERVAARYPPETELPLRERAALVAFRAGDPAALRRLRDRPDLGPKLSNRVISAAFGLTLRELGPHAAAQYLQAAREFTNERDWAILPTAAAYALTPFQVQLTTFLGRYERGLNDRGVPTDEAALWWLCRLRAVNKPMPAPPVDGNAGPELTFLRENATDISVGDDRLDELMLRFLLFAFAGPGFEDDALALAQRISTLSPEAVTAARFAAIRVAAIDGPTEAARRLNPTLLASPNDRSTFLLYGDLLVRSDADAATLLQLSTTGLANFPGDDDVERLCAMAALRAGAPDTARQILETLLARAPADIPALRIASQVARTPGHEDSGAFVARAVATNDVRDPILRSFVLERYLVGRAPDEEVVEVLGAITAADPTYYMGALALATQFENTQLDEELSGLATNIAAVIPGDPGAGASADVFMNFVRLLIRRELHDEALAFASAALLAQPAHTTLRRLRVELAGIGNASGQAISDLRLLCVLAPTDPQILFEYGNMLLAERTDLSDVVDEVRSRINELAADDERSHILDAKNRFRHDDLEGARAALSRAVALNPRDLDAWYYLGVYSYLDGDEDAARAALKKVKGRHPLIKRVRYLQKRL